MKASVLSRFTEIWLPSTALIIFLTVFLLMLLFVWRKSAASSYKNAKNLPFDEGMKK